MELLTKKDYWRYTFILMAGLGISNIGAWIYLLSLNLLLYDMTGSPLSIVILYTLGPLAALFTNSWSGSMIDRNSKRTLMIVLDVVRALIILLIPFISTVWVIYLTAFLINIANAMFKPASMVYITKLIPEEHRKKFNSLYSVMTSGAFLIGPAIAGLLFIVSSPVFALYFTGAAFLLSSIATWFMPEVEQATIPDNNKSSSSLLLVKEDWTLVVEFTRKHIAVFMIYLLFNGTMMVLATAVDSLEAVFSLEVLHLSNSEYGFLVSIAGAGIAAGSLCNMIYARWFSLFKLMGFGTLFVSGGYVIFAFSANFTLAAIGCFTLAFFISFANTGYLTFYQNNIPAEVMGRVGSIYGLMEALLIIVATLTLGALSELVSVQIAVRAGTLAMVLTAVSLIGYLYLSKGGSSLIKPGQ
ncbi:MFS transporter [Jeotgalibacillus sp. S-D1]|uniref:MFS transporter n=1 Tax=Jeotgalibacillus sp. S-D1 TaxID=2552189 RepID=UPI001F0EF3B2|nr:MFS transporter [Jeotgalibacillus sp. S-D1]